MNSSIEQLIQKGDLCFTQSKYDQAVSLYTEAIEQSNQKHLKAFLNRSATFIKQEKFNLAYQDAQHAAQLDAKNEIAFLRMATSAYSMRKFKEAKINYENCLLINKQNKIASKELSRTIERINELTTGNYDFEKLSTQLFQRTKNRESLNVDAADYKSNQIKVTDIPNKSKGIIATQNIALGTQLVVSKAVAAVFRYGQTNFVDTSEEMFANLEHKMKYDPELAEQVNSLCPGVGFERENNLNSDRLRGIIKTNQFNIHLNQFKFTEAANNFHDIYDINQVPGLWLLPSYFNHSCVANAGLEYLGDLLIITANKDIKANEEITLNYIGCNKNYSYNERLEFIKGFNFTCDCRLCELDRDDENLFKREILIDKLTIKNSMQFVDDLSEVLNDLK